MKVLSLFSSLSLLLRATRRKSRAFNNKLLTTYVTRDPFPATVDSQLTGALSGTAIKSSPGKRWQQQQIHNKRRATTEVVVHSIIFLPAAVVLKAISLLLTCCKLLLFLPCRVLSSSMLPTNTITKTRCTSLGDYTSLSLMSGHLQHFYGY